MTLVHLSDVMGAKVVNEFVKSLLKLWAVDFGKLLYCFSELFVHLGSAGYSVAVSSEKQNKKPKLLLNMSMSVLCLQVFPEE